MEEVQQITINCGFLSDHVDQLRLMVINSKYYLIIINIEDRQNT